MTLRSRSSSNNQYSLINTIIIASLTYMPDWPFYILATDTSLSPIRRGFAPSFVNDKTGALDSQPQVMKFTSCLSMIGGSLGYSGFFHHWNWSPWYSWNIAECGVKTPTIKIKSIGIPKVGKLNVAIDPSKRQIWIPFYPLLTESSKKAKT